MVWRCIIFFVDTLVSIGLGLVNQPSLIPSKLYILIVIEQSDESSEDRYHLHEYYLPYLLIYCTDIEDMPDVECQSLSRLYPKTGMIAQALVFSALSTSRSY